MDQSLHHPGPEHALGEVTGFEQFTACLAIHQFGDVGEGRVGHCEAAHHFFADFALADAGGVLEAAENQETAAFVIIDIGLFHIVVDRRLDRRAETRAHVDALGTEAECGDEAAAVAEAARGEHRDLDLVGGRRDQDQAGDIILARMARTFETVDRDDVAAGALGRQRVADRGAFVEDFDAVRLQHFPNFTHRRGACGFDDLDATIDDCLRIGLVIGGVDCREDGHVYAERLVGHRPAFFDFLAQRLGGRLGQCGDDAKAASVRYRAREFGIADALHPALHDRMFDTQHFGDARLESHETSFPVDADPTALTPSGSI